MGDIQRQELLQAGEFLRNHHLTPSFLLPTNHTVFVYPMNHNKPVNLKTLFTYLPICKYGEDYLIPQNLFKSPLPPILKAFRSNKILLLKGMHSSMLKSSICCLKVEVLIYTGWAYERPCLSDTWRRSFIKSASHVKLNWRWCKISNEKISKTKSNRYWNYWAKIKHEYSIWVQEKEGITAKLHLDRLEKCPLAKPLKLKNIKLQKEEAFGVQRTHH